MRRFISFIVGVVCGALVGSVAALLLAPAPGEEVRSQALGRLSTFRDEIREAYQTRMAQLEGELDSLRSPKAPQE
jgi:gas vesicle protein